MKNILILGGVLLIGAIILLVLGVGNDSKLKVDNLLIQNKDKAKDERIVNKKEDEGRDKLDAERTAEIEGEIKSNLQNYVNSGMVMDNGLLIPEVKIDKIELLFEDNVDSGSILISISGNKIPKEYDAEGVGVFLDSLSTNIRNYIIENYNNTGLKYYSIDFIVNGEKFENKSGELNDISKITKIRIPDYKYKNVGDKYDWVLEWRYINVPKTKEVLRFSYKDILGNNFKSISIKDGIAKLVINKNPSWLWRENPSEAAVMKNVEMNALQYDTVKKLEVYLNDNLINLCDYSQANPEESGCDKEQRYWIVDKK